MPSPNQSQTRPAARPFPSSPCAVFFVGAVGLAAGRCHRDRNRYNADAMAAQISNKLFADDGLARPVPDKPTISGVFPRARAGSHASS